jgi:ferric-dicitrate binding protein FerR (iron transport regulator)
VLDETPLEEVAVLLERWYGVKVIIKDDDLKKYKFSTTFENEPLNRVLELLELSSPALKIDYKPGKLTNETGEKNYSTVTISKK